MAILPTELTAALIADPLPGGAVPRPTQVGGVNVSAALEVQSTTRGLLVPRMSSAQRDAMAIPLNGMIIYNTTTNAMNSYENGTWGDSGNGDVIGPGAATVNSLGVFNNVTGTLLAASSVILNPISGIISAIGGLINNAGSAASPTISFMGDTNTGIYHVGADEVGIAANGALQFSATGASSAVNHLTVGGSATTLPITLSAIGSDATINISLLPKNNGQVLINAGAGGAPGLAFNGGSVSNSTGLYFNLGGAARTNYVATSVNGNPVCAINGNRVISLGSNTFDATSVNAIALAAGTQPTGIANTVQIYSGTNPGSTGVLGLDVVSSSITSSSTNTITNKLQIRLNGIVYYILLTNSSA